MPNYTIKEENGQVELTLPDGRAYKGASKDDVLDQMANAHIHASAAIQDRERQIHEQRQKLSQIERQILPPTEGGHFDADSYYKMLTDNKPVEAMKYVLQAALGMEDPVTAIKSSMHQTAVMSNEREVLRFHANCPDFPGGDAAGNALSMRLQQEGLQITAGNLEAAFRQLVREGTIKALAQETPITPPSRGEGAPPNIEQKTGQQVQDEILAFENMSLPEMEKELQKRGLRQ